MTFGIGAFVRLKTDPTRAGILQDGERLRAGSRMLPVQFPDGTLTWLPESALEPVPIAPVSLATRFAQGRFADSEWLRRTLARLRVTGRLSDVVYSMEATDTDFYAFQYKPVLKLLNSPTDGLLIADEVGLGKTIEAGLIWTELRARLQSNRLLVLCPKTLCEKWRTELFRRFGVDARVVGAAELLDLLSSSDGTGRGFAAIASMQSLRPPRGWNDDGETEVGRVTNPRQRLARFLDEAAEREPLLDLLVIDEAHHMRNPDTLLHTLAQLINSVTSHRVFLSATPIHLRNRDLHSLLRLIDPDTFEYEQTLDDLIELNAPIVEARDLLLKPDVSVEAILQRLNVASDHEFLSDSSSLKLIQDELRHSHLDRAKRAELASRLEHVNQLANYVTRTRRRDVEEFRVRRDPKAPALSMHPDEKEFYNAVTETVRHYATERDTSDGFLLSMPQRLLSSSPAAASEYWESILQHDLVADDDDSEIDRVNARPEDNQGLRPLVSRLTALARQMDFTKRLALCDTKYALLLRELRQIWQEEPGAKVIVFSSFKATLNYLRRRLADDIGHGSCELLHGSIKESRDVVLQRFRENEAAKILLSSEVGSEGIDLQFCWLVVNYDLPWNPMRLEQRIGRVDRLGQQKEVVVVLNLLFEGTIDQKIYERLYVRLGLGQKALGEFEAVLGTPIREMTKKLVDPRLSDQQKVEAIEQAAQAVEVLKRQEDDLEEQAGSLMRHGDYILQTIAESRRLHRWLSGEDILIYVRDRLHRSFPGCSIDASPPGSDNFRIRLSPTATEEFAAFLGRSGLRGTTRLLNGNDHQRFQFDPSVVKGRSGGAENISQMHPLVRFAAYLDARDEMGKQPEPIAATLRAEAVRSPIRAGTYVVGIRRWYANTGDGSVAGSSRIAYAGASHDTGEPLSSDVAEALASAVASHGRILPNAGNDGRLARAAKVFCETVMCDLDARFDEFERQVKAQVDDRVRIRRRALERHRNAKAQSLTSIRDQHRSRSEFHAREGDEKRARQRASLAEATEGKLRRLDESCNRRLAEIDALGEVTPEMTDVSAVFVEIN